jgi:hypothetical protein
VKSEECARDAPFVSPICRQLNCGEYLCRTGSCNLPRARTRFNMAPKRGLSIERTSEYEDFMKELAVFHEKRGYVNGVFQIPGHT